MIEIKSLRERKTEIKKMEILQKAAEVFRSKGFHSTSMDDIAKQLMMTKGSLYYYFKSKEEILYGCHDYSMNLALNFLREIQQSDDAVENKLRRLLVNHMRMLMTEPTALLVATELEPLKDSSHQKIMGKRRAFEVGLREILADGIAEGVFHPGDPKILGFIILGTINWVPQWYSTRGQMGAEQICSIFSDFLLRGLTKKEASQSYLEQSFGQFSNEMEECLRSSVMKLRSSMGLGFVFPSPSQGRKIKETRRTKAPPKEGAKT